MQPTDWLERAKEVSSSEKSGRCQASIIFSSAAMASRPLFLASAGENGDFDDELTSYWWVLGAAIHIFGSVMINLGTNVIRLDHTRQQKAGLRAPPFKRPIWMLGTTFFSLSA
jgi:hypothetical protein